MADPTRQAFVEILHRECDRAGIRWNVEAESLFLRVYYDEAERAFAGAMRLTILGIVGDYAAYRGEEPRLDSETSRFAGDSYFSRAANADSPGRVGLQVVNRAA